MFIEHSNTMKFWTWALDVASEQSPEDGRDMFDVLLKKCPMTLDDLVDCGIMSFTSVAVRSVHRYRFIMECIDLNNTELWQKVHLRLSYLLLFFFFFRCLVLCMLFLHQLARLVSSKVIRLPAVHTWPAPTNINEVHQCAYFFLLKQRDLYGLFLLDMFRHSSTT
jgi:hypothetical protein